MIYLISQMVVALAVAIVLGGAIGWLIHRGTHVRESRQLQQQLARHRSQLTHARAEVDLIADDYRELENRSQDRIAALQEENQHIPELTNNLERAQLLVNQSMKKHESRERDLNTENQRLLAELEPYRQRERLKQQQDAAVKQQLTDSPGEGEGDETLMMAMSESGLDVESDSGSASDSTSGSASTPGSAARSVSGSKSGSVSEPESDQYLNLKPDQYLNLNPDRHLNLNSDRYLSLNPDQYLNPKPDQYLNPNPNQYLNPNPNQCLNLNPVQYLNPNPDQHLSLKPDQYLNPKPDRYPKPSLDLNPGSVLNR